MGHRDTAIQMVLFKADKWIGQINLAEIIPQLTKNDPFDHLKPLINENLDDFFRHKLSAKAAHDLYVYWR